MTPCAGQSSCWTAFTDRESYAVGGGSVLAARWKHRSSTDIDLFFNSSSGVCDVPLGQIKEHVTALHRQGEVDDLMVYGNGFSCQCPFGLMSLFDMPSLTEEPVSEERESVAGVRAENTAEILLKKIRARMIHNTDYLARDVYDLVVSYLEDRDALDRAFSSLEANELRALLFDVSRGIIKPQNLDRILDPTYPGIAQLGKLERYANAVLSEIATAALESAGLALAFPDPSAVRLHKTTLKELLNLMRGPDALSKERFSPEI